MKLSIEKDSLITMHQFKVFRAIFGIFLCWHFLCLIPYAAEIFSQDGIINRSGVNPFHGKWPNPFFLWGSETFIQISLILGGLASVLFALGKLWRSSALYLWILHASLFTANPLTANPSLGYIGLLLLLCSIVPREASALPIWLPRVAWILLAVGYSFSGILKLGSPSWIDGSALGHLIENPLARPGLTRDIMLGLPDGLLALMTWSVLALEILFVPLAFFRQTRFLAWAAMVIMHLGIILTIDFADLSLGMLMAHLFTFQAEWWKHSVKVYQKHIAIKLSRLNQPRLITRH